MMREELIQTILERYEKLLIDLKNNKSAGVYETPAAPNTDDADIPKDQLGYDYKDSIY